MQLQISSVKFEHDMTKHDKRYGNNVPPGPMYYTYLRHKHTEYINFKCAKSTTFSAKKTKHLVQKT